MSVVIVIEPSVVLELGARSAILLGYLEMYQRGVSTYEGWFGVHEKYVLNDTGLTRNCQATARKFLVGAELLETKPGGTSAITMYKIKATVLQ